jgi:hypothetical protein
MVSARMTDDAGDVGIRRYFGGNRTSQIADGNDEVAAFYCDFSASAGGLEAFQKLQQRLFHDVFHELRPPPSGRQTAIGILQKKRKSCMR